MAIHRARLSAVHRITKAVRFAGMALIFAAGLTQGSVFAQQDPSLYAGMQWRQIGPFRAGRVSAVAGIAGNPAVYYIGTPGGGVWKTTDGGTVWKPISDSVPVASIGAIGVAASNPKIIYFGTGDVSEVGASVNQGNGMYKSTDGGETWQHCGLADTWHIGALWIDPRNPDVVVVAAFGHTFAPNEERGIFKTTDGGARWRKVLYKDDKTGAIDVTFDTNNPQIGFATLWAHYVPPGTPGGVLGGNTGGAIYKTTDGGETWTPVTGNRLPTGNMGRIGVAVALNGQRVLAIVAAQGADAGLYRSDDGGANWQRSTPDTRVTGVNYFSKVYMDPKNPDVVYVMQTSMYRSTDGGKNFISYKGAPGGDDNHVLWIDPTNSDWMIMGSDQGATVSLDGGKSWTSWYNQPTGQIYHLSTDNRFPYWVYGTQQDSGSVGTLSRGDYGAITFLDWDAVGAYEFGYIVPDPLNPNLVYAGGPARGLVRVDRTSRQVKNIGPNVSRNGDFRLAVNPPLEFDPLDPHALYEGTQFLMETRDGGTSWHKVSPDLTIRPDEPKPAPVPAATQGQPQPAPLRTSINTFSISAVRAGVIWVGTTNGLVQLTQDGGKTWKNVSPPGLTKTNLVSMVEASRFDPAGAYVALDAYETNDFRPHIYRTHNAGQTWQETVAGIPEDGSFVRVVREDTVRKGLLYAGTENAAYVSFDDGDHWSSLQLNMPTTSIRDMVIRNNDLVVCTYGRAFWILDDLTPLRQINKTVADSEAYLFQPEPAIRVRLNDNQDTPFPPEMPAGKNPPSGAILNYYLKSKAEGDITISIYDSQGKLVRALSSVPEQPLNEPPPNVPMYWVGKPQPLTKNAGTNRTVWDLRYTPLPALRHDYGISALPEETPADPRGPLVSPGKYDVRLTVAGKTYNQQLLVKADPRVKVTDPEFALQLELAKKAVAGATLAFDAHHQAADLRAEVADRIKALGDDGQAKPLADALREFDQKVGRIEGGAGGRGGGGGGAPAGGRPVPTFAGLLGNFDGLVGLVDGADSGPTAAMQTAYKDYCTDFTTVASQWNELRTTDIPALNEQLAGKNQPPLKVPQQLSIAACGGLGPISTAKANPKVAPKK